MGDDVVAPRTSFGGADPSALEHLVWHQDLICPGEPCRGRVRSFPPGELVDDGHHEQRRCPQCGTTTTAPAFYIARRAGRPRSGPHHV
ncbi:hypothetical protein [Actinomycetospora straminea]|nr:hypothetical protein [Actinomycetospora straminea]MDD7933262.1 hypothetical protein [Actinomycetospora straminea]